jgi:hypothetical protein
MAVDLSNYTDVGNVQNLALAVNNDVGGILFVGGMFAFYFIILLITYRISERNGEDFGVPFTATSWVMFIVSGFFWFAKLLPVVIPLLFLFISAFGVLYLYASKY